MSTNKLFWKTSILSFIVLLSLLILASCDHVETTVDTSAETNAKIVNSIVYIKDPKTDICFATVGSRGYLNFISMSISTVPCTPEVLRLVR